MEKIQIKIVILLASRNINGKWQNKIEKSKYALLTSVMT